MQLKSLDEFEKWANEVFIPEMMLVTEYNKDYISDWRTKRYFALGGVYYKLGKTRLRQLRVSPGIKSFQWTVK